MDINIKEMEDTNITKELQNCIAEVSGHLGCGGKPTSLGFIAEGIPCRGRCCIDGMGSFCQEPCKTSLELNQKLKQLYEMEAIANVDKYGVRFEGPLSIFFSPTDIEKIVKHRWVEMKNCKIGVHNFEDVEINEKKTSCEVCRMPVDQNALNKESAYDDPIAPWIQDFSQNLNTIPELSFFTRGNNSIIISTFRSSFFQKCTNCSFNACKMCTNLSGLLNKDYELVLKFNNEVGDHMQKVQLEKGSVEFKPEEVIKAMKEENSDTERVFYTLLPEEFKMKCYRERTRCLYLNAFRPDNTSSPYNIVPKNIEEELFEVVCQTKGDYWKTKQIVKDRYRTNIQKVPSIRSYLDVDFQITDERIIEFLEKYYYLEESVPGILKYAIVKLSVF